MNHYKILKNQQFKIGNFSIVPIRYEDRNEIMKWRNEQIYHLRQAKPLTKEDQENYFNTIVSKLFDETSPKQLLFSFLEKDVCIGYGGLVHINWIDKNAEVSFVMNTEIEKSEFHLHWTTYLQLIEKIAFVELKFKKIFTYAFDLRPHLYIAIESVGFKKEATLKDHCLFNNQFHDVIIHSKFNAQFDFNELNLRKATINDKELIYNWANNKVVRNNSMNQEKITWENHVIWFNKKLEDQNTKMYILEIKNIPVGQIRIDLIDSFWMIDYSIDEQYRGLGYGKLIIDLLMINLKNYSFKAIVKKDNIASNKVFKNLGFKNLDIENTELNYYQFN